MEIRGNNWNDLNGNGVRDLGEPGLAGVTIFLDLNNNGLLDATDVSTVTSSDNPATSVDETGQYQFIGLQPGNYTVREIVPPGFLQTFPTVNTGVNISGGSQIVNLGLGRSDLQKLLTFEGVGDLNPVKDFYAEQGISFSSNTLGLVDVDAGGNGNFGGEPSESTVISYKKGKSIILNLNQPISIVSGQLSFLYSSPNKTHKVKIYDGLNGTGNVLAEVTLPKTPAFGARDVKGEFGPFQPFSLNFTGNAKSIALGSVKKQIGIDNILLTLEPIPQGLTLIGTVNPDNLVGGAGDDTINGGVTGSGGFNFARTDFPAGDRPGNLTANDLDGDGDIDLAVTNSGYDAGVAGIFSGNTVLVLRNNGDGTFAAPVTYSTGVGPSATSADLDRDGDIDLVTANAEEDNISVLRNNGDGTFAAPVNFAAGDRPFITPAADLDRDGDLDLITVNSEALNLNTGIDIGSTISVLRNNGDGTFASPEILRAGNGVTSVTAADLDRDGDLDLATANEGENSVSLLRNNGNGRFAAPVKLTVGNRPADIVATDIDSDGDLDLTTSNFGGANVSVLRNNGDGTFAPAVAFRTENNPGSLNAADLDGDGDIDLAMRHSFFRTRTGERGGSSFSVLNNNGDGSFSTPVNFPVDNVPRSLIVANLNGNGNLDLATSNFDGNNVSVYLNTTVAAVGNDTLTGGAGKDSFVFNNPKEGVDTITDFVSGTDRIVISSVGFGSELTPGLPLPSNQFVLGTTALDNGDRFIYDPSTSTLFFDPDGIGAVVPVQLAILSSSPALSAADIFVI